MWQLIEFDRSSTSLIWYWRLKSNHNWFKRRNRNRQIEVSQFCIVRNVNSLFSTICSLQYLFSWKSDNKSTTPANITFWPVRIQQLKVIINGAGILVGCRVAFWKKCRPSSLGWAREDSKPNLSEKNWNAFWTSCWISSSLYPRISRTLMIPTLMICVMRWGIAYQQKTCF